MGIFSTTLTLCCLDAMHISPAWKHADTLEAFEYRERAERKKKMSGSKCFSNSYRFNSMVWREG